MTALGKALDAAVASSIALRAVHAVISKARQPLSDRTVDLLHDMFRNPAAFRRARDIIRNSGVTPTTINAELARASLSALHDQLTGACVAHSFSMAAVLRKSQSLIVNAVGCGSVDTLGRAAKKVTGLPHGRMVRDLSSSEICARIVAFCTRPRHDAGDAMAAMLKSDVTPDVVAP